eukprot:14722515-Alexandrium_andersonii.AAC.1
MCTTGPSTLRPGSSPGLGGREGGAVEGVADEALLGEVPERGERTARGSPGTRRGGSSLGAGGAAPRRARTSWDW